jgi:hypothetical protein
MAKGPLRILIVSFNFPPLPKVGSLRPLSWARRWSELGHSVSVLTARHFMDGDSSPLPLDEQTLKRVHVEEVPYRRLITPGAPSRSSGDGSSEPPPKGASMILRRLPKKAAWAAVRYIGVDIKSPHLWTLPAVRRIRNLCRERSYDIVVSSYSPAGSHIAAAAARKHSVPFWVADYRDLWSGNHFFEGGWPFSSFERGIESRVVKRADLLTATSEPMREKLEARFGTETLTVPNGYDEESDKTESGPFLPRDGRKRIVYTGTVYLSRQDPGALFRAMETLRKRDPRLPDKLEVVILGEPIGDLDGAVAAAGVSDMVRCCGLVDRGRALQAQREADLLLFLDWTDSGVKGVMAAKLYEYIRSGTPILSLGIDRASVAARLIEDTATGYVAAGRESEVTGLLESLVAGTLADHRPRDEIIARYNRAVIAEEMLRDVIDRWERCRRF